MLIAVNHQEKVTYQHSYQQYNTCIQIPMFKRSNLQTAIRGLILIVDSISREVGCSNGKGCLFYLSMKQVTSDFFEQPTSLPYFNLQVSFGGNLPPVQSNEGALSATLVGE